MMKKILSYALVAALFVGVLGVNARRNDDGDQREERGGRGRDGGRQSGRGDGEGRREGKDGGRNRSSASDVNRSFDDIDDLIKRSQDKIDRSTNSLGKKMNDASGVTAQMKPLVDALDAASKASAAAKSALTDMASKSAAKPAEVTIAADAVTGK